MSFADQLQKIKTGSGFIAALDQSGGSTPKALKVYGVGEDQYHGDAEMFDQVHAMRTRIMTNEAFTGEDILGAILFEDTLSRTVAGHPTAEYLWEVKRVVPFLKVDKGLADESDDVQLMKSIPGLDVTLSHAKSKGVFGTKMRSVIKRANAKGIADIVAQQFEVGRQIIAAGLIPIIEPEIDIHAPDKAEAEALLRDELLKALDTLGADENIMLKLTLPNESNFYADLIAHPRVLKVVALSGGYSQDEANAKLSTNKGMVASFSRALTEGLLAQQTDEAFTNMIGDSIRKIAAASNT